MSNVRQLKIQNDLAPTHNVQTHYHNVKQYCVVSFGFIYFHQKKYLNLICNGCDEYEQVNSG